MVKARVLGYRCRERKRVSLGIKQLSKDNFADTAAQLKKGTMWSPARFRKSPMVGSRSCSTDGVTGFIKKKRPLARDRADQRPDRFAVGEKVDAKILTVDTKSRKISLSIKAREVEEDKQAMAEYGSSDSGASLGDILGAALSKAKKGKKDDSEA